MDQPLWLSIPGGVMIGGHLSGEAPASHVMALVRNAHTPALTHAHPCDVDLRAQLVAVARNHQREDEIRGLDAGRGECR